MAPGAADADLAAHWLISLPAARLERWFSPPISRSELAGMFPGAVLIPLPEIAPARAGASLDGPATRWLLIDKGRLYRLPFASPIPKVVMSRPKTTTKKA